ncbi:dihydroxyacetone kinase subunit DhaK [Glycomyces tenuis]|uniref:dihydroxyacetone kinase subunit DhaK n=1 Tax=Glycomyces tenuis TaxID=58116 RepID=UPI000419225C|nr:dihydroxyacetone kinase subunit DhaK [Glycomyces tenuis]
MQRFVNDPDHVVEDLLAGYVKAHPETAISTRNPRVLALADPVPGKVGLVTGGGSGHEPAFLGYVGPGLLDAAAVGEVFASPPAKVFYDAFVEADQGAGVACLFGNYAGDNMNVKMAVDMAEDDGIVVKYVVATDDLASAPADAVSRRHGIAGGFFMWKIAGAAAAEGADLDRVVAVAQDVVDRTRSLCVGLEPLTIPAVGQPGFSITPGTMEVGIGHHGENGIRTETYTSAADAAAIIVEAVLQDFAFSGPRRLAVMVSGLGATPAMEPYIVYGAVASELEAHGHAIVESYVGDFVTSLDMNGVSVSVIDLDENLHRLLKAPGRAVGLPTY